MHMKVQGHPIQTRLIEIHQVFAKKNKVRYFSNRPHSSISSSSSKIINVSVYDTVKNVGLLV